ncbi:hypothetical protein BC2230_80237 [Burkholderia cepacia]
MAWSRLRRSGQSLALRLMNPQRVKTMAALNSRSGLRGTHQTDRNGPCRSFAPGSMGHFIVS